MSYPVSYDIERQPVFQRAHVFLRVALLIAIGESVWRFLCSLARWEASLFAYLASLTDRYPPVALETGSVSSPAPSS